MLHLLDSDTHAPAWPRNGYRYIKETKETAKVAEAAAAEDHQQKGPKIDPALLENSLRNACDVAIKAEPDITKWDIQMGDGDCGEAVVGMCQGVLRKLDEGLAKQGSFFHILDQVGEAVEEIGGTLGAIISIILASFTTSLRQAYAKEESGFTLDAQTAGRAAGAALENLQSYTSARQGGRTVMDTLIPFCQSLEKEANFQKAVEEAEAGAESTSGMKAKFGRGECSYCKRRFPARPPEFIRLTSISYVYRRSSRGSARYATGSGCQSSSILPSWAARRSEQVDHSALVSDSSQ